MTEEEKDRHIAYLERMVEIQQRLLKVRLDALDEQDKLIKQLLTLGQQYQALQERSDMINAEREGLEKKYTLQ